MDTEAKAILDDIMDYCTGMYARSDYKLCPDDFPTTMRKGLWTLFIEWYSRRFSDKGISCQKYKRFFLNKGLEETKTNDGFYIRFGGFCFYFLEISGFCSQCLLRDEPDKPINNVNLSVSELLIPPENLFFLMQQYVEYQPDFTEAVKEFERDRLIHTIEKTTETASKINDNHQ